MIMNLTQHPATQAQREAGVVEPFDKARVQQLLTFEELPSVSEICEAATALAAVALAAEAKSAMIGGAPFLMAPLEAALRQVGVRPLYAFSRRESAERPRPDGGVEKVVTFRHLGFVDATNPDALTSS